MSRAEAPCVRLERGAPGYPPALLDRLGADAPATLLARGALPLLRAPLTALFCSVRVPPELVLPTYDLARALRASERPVVGGFQAPLERECLDFLLRGGHPVVVCPAREIAGMRLPAGWREAMEAERLLLLSGCPTVRRPTRALSMRRNRLAAALAERVVVAFASAGGGLRRMAEEAVGWRTPVACLSHPLNHDLFLLGAVAVEPVAPTGAEARWELRVAPPPPPP